MCPDPTTALLYPDFTNPKANILIGGNGRACLTDFANPNLAALSDQSSNQSQAGLDTTTRWMSPELFDPDRFGLENGCPTKESNCYALGMVIYEVLSRRRPFAPLRGFIIMRKVLDGERPKRPRGVRGAWFQDNVWEMLERCWEEQPKDRPSLNTVLLCLQGATRPPGPSFHVDEDPEDLETDSGDQPDASVSHPCMFSPSRPKFQAYLQLFL